jgi:maleate isomerase
MTGWRAKLGFLIPPGTPTVEREMYELAPQGVSVHFARMVARGAVGTLDNLQQRAASHLAHMDATVEMLASVEPDVIVLAHTATSYVLGKDGEEKLTRHIEELTGIPFISALRSAIATFDVLGAHKVAVGTAYDEALTLKGKAVLEDYGVDVVNATWLPDVKSIFEETERRVYGLGRNADRPAAQALFLSGVGLPTLSVLGALETDLGKPVISSASAMMWNALRVSGIGASISGYGRLLQDARYRFMPGSHSKHSATNAG